jgi:hypothetical protein
MGNPPPEVPPLSRWRRHFPGWEILEIQHVWYWPDRGWVVRGCPVRGRGVPFVTSIAFLRKHYDRLPDGT